MGLDQDKLFAIMSALGVTQGGGGGGGFGGGFGGGAPLVNTGDYLVSITIDGKVMQQTLRVVQHSGGGMAGFPFEVEAMLNAYAEWMNDHQ